MIAIKNYDKSKIMVGESINNLLDYVPQEYHNSMVIITDLNVEKFHKNKFPNAPVITIGLIEKVRTQTTVDYIVSELLKIGADRHWFLVGIGGGIVCDITGYVGSVYMRGVKFGYVPTSLLAQVDASVGGKTGINFQNYKNIIGVFNQPQFVICDLDVLKTLPVEELKNGLVEAIKHGLINSLSLFEFIESNWSKIVEGDKAALYHIVLTSIEIKSKIVILDEFEKGERKKLNLGHSYGHAIESLSGISHGSAVAIGLVFAVNLSVKMGFCSTEVVRRIETLLHALKMETVCALPKEELIQHVLKDKKRKQDEIDFVFINNIGGVVVNVVSFELLMDMSKLSNS